MEPIRLPSDYPHNDAAPAGVDVPTPDTTRPLGQRPPMGRATAPLGSLVSGPGPDGDPPAAILWGVEDASE